MDTIGNQSALGQFQPAKAGLGPDELRGADVGKMASLLGGHWPSTEEQRQQMARELETWTSSYDRVLLDWQKAKEAGDPLRASPVRKLLEAWVGPLAAVIDRYAQAATRASGRRPKWLSAYKEIGAGTMAFYTLSALLKATADFKSGRTKDGRLRSSHAARQIGDAVCTATRMSAWRRLNPALYAAYERRLDEAGATAGHREMVMRIGLERKARNGEQATPEFIEATDKWSTADRSSCGLWLLIVAEHALDGAILLEKTHSGKKNRTHYAVVLAREVTEWMEEAVRRSALRAFDQRPMLCPPLPWSGPEGGGYLLGLKRRLVPGAQMEANRVQNELLNERPPEAVLEAVNSLQAVPWEINPEVLQVAQQAAAADLDLDGLPQSYREPIPPKPRDVENKDEMSKWRADAAAANRRNAKRASRSLQALGLLREAGELYHQPRFYFPHFCDFRGRVYAGGRAPNPQGDDLSKHMLLFAEGKPIGDGDGPGWLAAQVAKACGQDKLTWEDRIQWTLANTKGVIEQIRSDPLGNRQLWEDLGDGIWAALAATTEWHAYDVRGRSGDFVTKLPCYIDGTCNGIQHYAALARDERMARLVNLEPGEGKNDIYQAVADELYERVKWELENGDRREAGLWLRLLGEKAPRTLAKKVVMVKPYGGTMKVTLDEVRKFWAESGGSAEWRDVDPREQPKLQGWLAKRLQQALGTRVGAADEIMRWLQKCAKVLAANEVPLGAVWETPSGWPWLNGYLAVATRQVFVKVGGDRGRRGQVHTLALSEEITTKPDVQKQATGIAPNFVHALDAAALALAICTAQANGVSQITAIHDSVGGLAPDMSVISKAVRMGFIEVHEADPLSSFRSAVIAALPEHARDDVPLAPEPGGFDIRRVLDSDYFFC